MTSIKRLEFISLLGGAGLNGQDGGRPVLVIRYADYHLSNHQLHRDKAT
jgi:hypothetical protein